MPFVHSAYNGTWPPFSLLPSCFHKITLFKGCDRTIATFVAYLIYIQIQNITIMNTVQMLTTWNWVKCRLVRCYLVKLNWLESCNFLLHIFEISLIFHGFHWLFNALAFFPWCHKFHQCLIIFILCILQIAIYTCEIVNLLKNFFASLHLDIETNKCASVALQTKFIFEMKENEDSYDVKYTESSLSLCKFIVMPSLKNRIIRLTSITEEFGA